MKHFQWLFSILIVCLITQSLQPHGFGASTFVKTSQGWSHIQQIAIHSKKKVQDVFSYHLNSKTTCYRSVTSAAQSTTNCYIKLCFDEMIFDDILCTPSQEFYLSEHNQWIAACQLKVGDKLLSEGYKLKAITYLEFVKTPLRVYSIEVEETHTFFVGQYSILTHNMLLPAMLTSHACISLCSGSGAVIGVLGGPIGVASCIVGGTLLGLVIKSILDNQIKHYRLEYDVAATDRLFASNSEVKKEKAPGRPTEKDGFIPRKKWDGKKVPHPRTGQYGYPDKNGDVWVPTGEGPLAHGGPHWDVVDPKGEKKADVYPGGKVR